MKYLLKRINDGQQWTSENVKYIEWKEDHTFGALHDDIAIDRSCILNPERGFSYQWLTTTVQRIDQRDDETHFFTENSHYIIKQLDQH